MTMMLRGNLNFTWIPPCTYIKKIKNKVTKKAPIFDRLLSLCTLRACNAGASNQGMQHLFEHGLTPNSYCRKKYQLILRGSAGRSSLIPQFSVKEFISIVPPGGSVCSPLMYRLLILMLQIFVVVSFLKWAKHPLFIPYRLLEVLFLVYFAWFCVIYTNTVQYLTD